MTSWLRHHIWFCAVFLAFQDICLWNQRDTNILGFNLLKKGQRHFVISQTLIWLWYNVIQGSHGQWNSVKKNQGQGTDREFWFGSGKSYFYSQVREKSGNFIFRLLLAMLSARKLWQTFQSYALVWQGQATCAGSNTCRLILSLEVWGWITHVLDSLTSAKVQFFISVAKVLQTFLKKYQIGKPVVPFITEDLLFISNAFIGK